MTRQETFKRRIRERMTKTGERYGAARRSLLDSRSEAHSNGTRPWVANPEQPDEVIRTKTGRAWDDWVGLVDEGPGRDAGHTTIARWLVDEHGVHPWWAQAVTVGYERITGLRLPGQMPDGTFTVSRSRIVKLEADALRALLLDDAARADLFPGFDTVLRSKPASKSLRYSFARDNDSLGVVMFSLDPAPGERVRITVTHEKLASVEAGDHWKEFWTEWLAAVEQVSEAD